MTDEKVLNELERLEKHSTPGPWRGKHYKKRLPDVIPANMVAVINAYRGVESEEEDGGPDAWKANGDLIASLRNNASSLIADSRRLKKLEAAARELWALARIIGREDTARSICTTFDWCSHCGGYGEVCPSGPGDAPMNACPKCGGSGSVEPASPSVESK